MNDEGHRAERIWEHTWREPVPEPLADVAGGSYRVHTFRIIGWFEPLDGGGEVLVALHFEEMCQDALGGISWRPADAETCMPAFVLLLIKARLLSADVVTNAEI